MKHNTHIYIAQKAIEFLYDSLDNLKTPAGSTVNSKTRAKIKNEAKTLQRLLNFHKGRIAEATWAPDDIICDKAVFHTFKLFTAEEFEDFADFAAETHEVNGKVYYRVSGGGGLPFKVDHLARIISDLIKLRNYNDSYSMQQIMYQFLLISHYVVDAHVPMHCDIRDDKPSDKKPKKGKYYSSRIHGKIEDIWDEACTPVGISEEHLERERAQDSIYPTEYSPLVTFNLDDNVKEIKTVSLKSNQLMNYMISVCAESKERSLMFFPIDSPDNFSEATLKEHTRSVFAGAIGSLISVWTSIWMN